MTDANWHKYCRKVMRTCRSDSEEEKDNNGAGDEVNGEEKEVSVEDQIAVYKRLVTRRGKRKAQNALMRMGRPMWYSIFSRSQRSTRLEEAVDLAARKLMHGWSLEKENYKEENMFGVASMLCRLGVHLCTTSELASRVVSDFMAILAYVNYKMDGYLSTYASDPVLTLGAIKVWYELENGLAKYILPHFQKLILTETLDTVASGVMVACILMLLAMDKCVLGGGASPDYKRIGQFVPLETFLEQFIGCGFCRVKLGWIPSKFRVGHLHKSNDHNSWQN
ncbi:hypothetical protein V7S43_011269 [Phytophthora oleae]|uniref:Uncharacterized protein n=1 Tax=Phytophthora oleae TaxID=2107226 RepID=A0ABD3FAH3_9STRA